MAEELPWGVSVEEVLALASHTSLAEPAPIGQPVDDVYGEDKPERQITREQVEVWIRDVGAHVAAVLRRRASLTDVELRGVLDGAARTIVINGAASHLVAAAHPSQASINSAADYNAVLWDRYKTGLDELKAMLDEWLTDDTVALPGGGAPNGRTHHSFPAPLFPDGMRW